MPKFSKVFALIAAFCLLNACSKKGVDGTVRIVLNENPKSLDPTVSTDALAAEIQGAVYEQLFQYSYFKRPYSIDPLLANGMPSFSKDEKTITIKIKPGIRFQDDPCFEGGKGRELTAQDFIYEMKRIADPKIASESFWLVDKKILGLNEWREKQTKTINTDYDESVEGLQAPDPHTLVVKLTQKYPQFLYVLAMAPMAPVPREALAKYGPEFMNHPVGTGPFKIKEYVQNSKIIFVKNENFHDEKFPEIDPSAPVGSDESRGDVGKKLPLADKVEVSFIVEDQPRWLKLMKGEVDHGRIPKDNLPQAITPDGKIKPELAQKGFIVHISDSTTTWWLTINMSDPILGKNKLLRKAIALTIDTRKELELFQYGQGAVEGQILPATVKGYNHSIPPRKADLEKAKKLLAQAGYPGGKGLPAFNFEVQSSTTQRQLAEFYQSQLAQIGIKLNIAVNTRPQLLEKKRKGMVQLHEDGWIADYPDAENFMQLLYSRNVAPGPNNAQFKNTEFDRLYEKMAVMRDGPERQKVIDRMTQIVLDEQPWVPGFTAKIFNLSTGWLQNYVYSDFAYNWYKYLRVDVERKKELLKKF